MRAAEFREKSVREWGKLNREGNIERGYSLGAQERERGVQLIMQFYIRELLWLRGGVRQELIL